MTHNADIDAPALDWWITSHFFDRGGEKVMGPFVSRNLAMEVRTLLETVKGRCDFFIDSETRVIPPAVTQEPA